jgi:hypothetical protein
MFLRIRVLAVATLALLSCSLVAAERIKLIRFPLGEDDLEFVGQFNNTPTTSQQFGYLSSIRGLSTIFTGTPESENTASFTFVTNATTDRTILNGPFKIVNRTGTTTIYLNNGPSDFANPASFSQGTPIQVSSYQQQVILNTLTNAFVTVHINTISKTESFTLNGDAYLFGFRGQSFRTTYSGQSNAAGAMPSGWFAGYAVGIE